MKARKILASCLLIAGIGAGGWATNELFISDIHAHNANEVLVSEVEEQILAPVTANRRNESPTRDASGGMTAKKSTDSRAYAILEAEKLGRLPVVQGKLDDYEANQALINEGLVVRYQSTNEIGNQPGNTALIAHRLTHGSIFKRVPDMKLDERLTLATADGSYEYRVIRIAHRSGSMDNSPLYEPLGRGIDAGERSLLTLITCGNWLTDHREIVVLELVEAP